MNRIKFRKTLALFLALSFMTAAASCGKAPAEETETSAETTETTTVETTETEAPTEEILAPIIVETEPPFIPFTLHDRSIDEANDENFISLLTHLVTAYENPTEEDDWRIYNDLENIQAVSQEDYELANFIVDNWCEVFLYMDYNVNTYPDEVPAEIPNSSDHALVILGYELENGQMQDELVGRLNAAAALAKARPETIIVCSGGATGPNNREGNTEAGLMRDYLVDECGIDPARIFIDERALTTADNAIYTFDIFQEQGIHSMTIVTSTYHIRWGQMVYRTLAYLYSVQQDYPIEDISNYCYDTEPTVSVYRAGHRFAACQIAEILGLPQSEVNQLPSVYDY